MITFVRSDPDGYDVSPDEAAWLPVLGPTAWLLGQLAHEELRTAPTVTWEPERLARRLGVGLGGHKHKPLANAFNRLVRYGVATVRDDGKVAVRGRWGNAPTPARERKTDAQPALHE